jgi:glycosyltransferase involved in cell wall biosynthesis
VDVFARFELVTREIFNFVDTDCFAFRERTPLRPVFLSNRNLEPMYNVGCVLRAFAIIQQRWPEARLIVAGNGSQRDELEKLGRELKLRNVEFRGRVAPEKMPELYSEADVYLNGSNIDNMPGSIIEAFASGLPVVTTDAGGIPYIVSDRVTGLMTPCGDHQTMARLAMRLFDDKAMTYTMVGRAREECNKYSWDSVRSEWLKLYRDLDPSRERILARSH